MDDCETVPFLSVVAGLLLCNNKISAIDLINFISRISSLNIEVDDDSDLSYLSFCVDVDKNYSFRLKEGINYQTKLECGVSVFYFLKDFAGDKILECLKKDSVYKDIYQKNLSFYEKNDTFFCTPQLINKQVKKRSLLSFRRKIKFG